MPPTAGGVAINEKGPDRPALEWQCAGNADAPQAGAAASVGAYALDLDRQLDLGLEAHLDAVVDAEVGSVEGGIGVGTAGLALEHRMLDAHTHLRVEFLTYLLIVLGELKMIDLHRDNVIGEGNEWTTDDVNAASLLPKREREEQSLRRTQNVCEAPDVSIFTRHGRQIELDSFDSIDPWSFVLACGLRAKQGQKTKDEQCAVESIN